MIRVFRAPDVPDPCFMRGAPVARFDIKLVINQAAIPTFSHLVERLTITAFAF